MTKKKTGAKPSEPILGPAIRVNVIIDERTKETLEQVGHNSMSAGIRYLARKHRENQK